MVNVPTSMQPLVCLNTVESNAAETIFAQDHLTVYLGKIETQPDVYNEPNRVSSLSAFIDLGGRTCDAIEVESASDMPSLSKDVVVDIKSKHQSHDQCFKKLNSFKFPALAQPWPFMGFPAPFFGILQHEYALMR